MTTLFLDHSYCRDLPDLCSSCDPVPCHKPSLLYFNHGLAESLRLSSEFTDKDQLARLWSGNGLIEQMKPIAQAYSGHQFGHFNHNLGDGRALMLGEWVGADRQRVDISLKGSGTTPYSRGGDGRAAVGPMLREVLISEAMHALGVPSTRSLAVVATGEAVFRERPLPGAVLTRVAGSHIRIGTFEYPASRQQFDNLKLLADYTIKRHFPDLAESDQPYLELLRAVQAQQAELVAQWMSLGFIHGVMNTDNISIAGETIDYGPCAFIEHYNPATVFSSIDQQGRYAYQNQPAIMNWNLARLAETLVPLIDENLDKAIELATEVVQSFGQAYQAAWLTRFRAKLGLTDENDVKEARDAMLINDWLAILKDQQMDFTRSWRLLGNVILNKTHRLREECSDWEAVEKWIEEWKKRCEQEPGEISDEMRAQQMQETNPWIIPRNHHVEAALESASDDGDLKLFEALLNAVMKPFEEQADMEHYGEAASKSFTQCHKTFCGT